MKLGLLLCDDVQNQLQPMHGNYPAMFESSLKKQNPEVELVVYRILDQQLPTSTSECEGWIISGSRHGVNDSFPWITALGSFIKQLYIENKKLVGICFGHQMIAKCLGGTVELSDKGWGIGISENQVIENKPWMNPSVRAFRLLVSHKEQIAQLPDSAEVLAASNFCPYYMVQYGKHFMSIQGHPEFSPSYSADLIDSRRHIIPATCINQGIESLKKEPDSGLICRWLLAFLADSSD